MRDSPPAFMPVGKGREKPADELSPSPGEEPGDTRTLSGSARRRLQRASRKTRDAERRRRYRPILLLTEGWRPALIAQTLGCACRTIDPVRRRLVEDGDAGLVDRREDNGPGRSPPSICRPSGRCVGPRAPKA